MYDITLEEILTHYISRVRIALENIDKQKKDIEKMSELIQDGLYGDLKDVLMVKLDESLDETKEIRNHLEDSLYFLKRQLNEVEEEQNANNQIFFW